MNLAYGFLKNMLKKLFKKYDRFSMWSHYLNPIIQYEQIF